MTRVLLTGANGFIGARIIAPLVQHGYEVHAVGRHPPAQAGTTFHRADLLDAESIRSTVRIVQATHLVHLAWDAEPGRFWTSSSNLEWASNGLCLLKAFAETGGKRAVMAGTCAEYDWRQRGTFDETCPCEPATLYGAAKDGLRRIATSYSATSGLSFAWCRIFFLYGPGEKSGRLVSDAVRTLLGAGTFATTTGTQKRDYLHVDDAACAIAAVLRSRVHGAVNIGSGRSIPVRRLLEEIARQTGGEERLDFGARPPAANDPPEITAVTDRLFNEVGFRPQIALKAGLGDTIDWWRRHGPYRS